MTFGEKLRIARKEKKLTQKELASLIGAAHNSISNWENDQNKPDPDTIQNLCWVLGVTPNYFFLGDDAQPMSSNILPMPNFVKKPRVGAIACGTPILAEQNIECYDDVPDYVRCDFTLACKGDSMINARIFDGDIVCIRAQKTVESGAIAAVLLDGEEATLKRVRLFPDRISLEPENPMYSPIVLWGEEMNRVEIIGKATHFISSVR